MECDYLVVGAGFFGSVLAERIANELGANVVVIDKRDHIGGNCYSAEDQETGIEHHLYGTHIFHTSSQKVWDYITQFTSFNGYHHQVLTKYKGVVYQMPVNLETINTFYEKNFTPTEARRFIEKEIEKENIVEPKNFEEKAISLIGRPLYEAFIKSYTIKQWDKNPQDLPASIIARLPVRFNYCEDYFHDAVWQGVPSGGYTMIFENMLNSSGIRIRLNCDYFECRDEFKVKKKIIYTGPIDRYFDYRYGKLAWRSISLEKKVVDVEDYQGTSVMNYADLDVPYTRIHEPQHLHLERNYAKKQSLIFFETSCNNPMEPYYPVHTQEDKSNLKKYKSLAKAEGNVIFGGRLGDYAYYDMDKIILAALECFEAAFLNV